jgi:hypothetical protein
MAASLPVFTGYRFQAPQYGNGFLDILKSIGKFILPIFASGAGSFFSGVSNRTNEGQSLGEAAKGSLKEAGLATAKAGLDAGSAQIDKIQKGKGRKRGRKRGRRADKKHPQYKKRTRLNEFKYNF